MEYTKDIILDIRCKKREGIYRIGQVLNKVNVLKEKIYKTIKNNKFISLVLVSLVILSIMDIVLVNCFFKILASMY